MQLCWLVGLGGKRWALIDEHFAPLLRAAGGWVPQARCVRWPPSRGSWPANRPSSPRCTQLLGRSYPLTVRARGATLSCLVDLEASGRAEDLQTAHELRNEEQRVTTQALQAAAAELGLD